MTCFLFRFGQQGRPHDTGGKPHRPVRARAANSNPLVLHPRCHFVRFNAHDQKSRSTFTALELASLHSISFFFASVHFGSVSSRMRSSLAVTPPPLFTSLLQPTLFTHPNSVLFATFCFTSLLLDFTASQLIAFHFYACPPHARHVTPRFTSLQSITSIYNYLSQYCYSTASHFDFISFHSIPFSLLSKPPLTQTTPITLTLIHFASLYITSPRQA